MRLLLDTNILVRNANRTDPRHGAIARALESAVRNGDELCIVPQNLFEFWVVAMRSVEFNGLGFPVADAERQVRQFLDAYVLLPEPNGLLMRWLEVCARGQVTGRRAHDARLVACMHANAIRSLLTLNAADFRGFDDVECLEPIG